MMKSTKKGHLEEKQKQRSQSPFPVAEEKKPGYGDKKLEGPNRPST